MDIFVFNNPNEPLLMEEGEIVNGITSKMWVERYAEAGEFTFVAPVSSRIRSKLPIGSFVSHTNTPEIMIVENHEINDDEGEDSKVTITGRTFESFLEQRVVGSNRVFPRAVSDGKFSIPSQKSWDQIVHVIRQHIDTVYLAEDANAVPHVNVITFVTGATDRTARKVDIKDLYSVVQELLPIDRLGIKNYRPGIWSPIGSSATATAMVIHRGIDRTEEIGFSYDAGEIISADYLWSNKKLKTSALVQGKWIQTMVHLSGKTHYKRRMMIVDAQDIDEDLDEATALVAGFAIGEELKKRGKETLKRHNDIVLTKAEVSKQIIDRRYRVDYNVGDLVTVVGDYNETSVMRVSEFVEIEDETGTSAYPTLTLETEETE